MELSNAERLQRLQMADLGTARREYISTADNNRYSRVRLEDIEASRMSNIPGSEAQRLAQANKQKLNEWSNMYKKVGDSEDFEQLSNLMDGQSHRAQLSAKIRESGGQTYSKTATKSSSLFDPSNATAHRGAQSSGRGGGVIGTRGRGPVPKPTRYTPIRTNAAPDEATMGRGHVSKASVASAVPAYAQSAAKLGHHIVSPAPTSRPRPLDPALDPSEDFYKSSRDQNKKVKEKSKGGSKAQGQSTPRARHESSNVDFSRILSNPDDFMAYARSMAAGRSVDPTPKEPAPASKSHSPGKEKDEQRYTSIQISKTPNQNPTHEPISRPGNVSGSRPSIGTQQGRPSTVEQSTKSSTQTSTEKGVSQNVAKPKPGASVSQIPASIPITGNGQRSQSASTDLKSSVSGVTKNPQPKGPATTGSQASQDQGLTPRRGENAEVDLLLNVTVSPSSDESISSRLGKMTLSPGIEELQGIDFHINSSYQTSQEALSPPPGLSQPAKKVNPEQHRTEKNEEVLEDVETETPQKTLPPDQPGIVYPGDNVSFDRFLSDKNKPQVTSRKGPTSTSTNSQIETYRREILDIENYIKDKSPDSLTARALLSLKHDFEAKIRDALKKSVNTPITYPKESQSQNVTTTPQAATLTGTSTKVSRTLQQEESKELKMGRLPPAQSTPVDKKSQPKPHAANSPIKKTASPLAAAVTAAPFVPGTMASFTQYRSRQSSVSSDSTIYHQAPSTISNSEATTSHEFVSTSSHIIGDHLLPGYCNRESTVSLSNEYHTSESVQGKSTLETPPQSPGSPNALAAGFRPFDRCPSPLPVPPKLAAPSDLFKVPTKASAIAVTPAESPCARKVDQSPSTVERSMHAPITSISQDTAAAKSTKVVSGARQQSQNFPSLPQYPFSEQSARVVSDGIQQSKWAPTELQYPIRGQSARAGSGVLQSRWAPTELENTTSSKHSKIFAAELAKSKYAPKNPDKYNLFG